jgi:hypothetical protein
VIVASEAFDDADGWEDVPDDHLLIATRTAVALRHLTDVPLAAREADELLLEAP